MSIAPVAEGDRIKTLDVVRGFAVLGILAVNATFFAAPFQNTFNPALRPLGVTDDTLWSWWIMHVVFEVKCITLFSMLFGVSIYLVGGEAGDPERGDILRRRLFWLLIVGLLHATLLWYGDVLVAYALTGFFVMFARSWPPRALLIGGIVLVAIATWAQIEGIRGFQALDAAQVAQMELRMHAPPAEELQRQIQAYQAVGTGIAENVSTWMLVLMSLPFLIIRTAGLMLIGLALFKWGFLSGRAPKWLYGLMIAIGAVAFVFIGWQANINAASGFAFEQMQTYGRLLNDVLAIFGSLFYASVLILLVQAGARFLTEPLAAVGRMALTNYLTQSLIMTTIFWGGRGFGLYGDVDRPTLWLIVLAVWVLQLIWSPLWLSRFQFGPFEWLWRRLTYGRPLRISRTTPAAA